MPQKLVNSSYTQCIVPTCTDLPNFAIIIEGASAFGHPYRVTTILTCGEHIDEGDMIARTTYRGYAREIHDNPAWLLGLQGRRVEEREERINRRRPRYANELSDDYFYFLFGVRRENGGR